MPDRSISYITFCGVTWAYLSVKTGQGRFKPSLFGRHELYLRSVSKVAYQVLHTIWFQVPCYSQSHRNSERQISKLLWLFGILSVCNNYFAILLCKNVKLKYSSHHKSLDNNTHPIQSQLSWPYWSTLRAEWMAERRNKKTWNGTGAHPV